MYRNLIHQIISKEDLKYFDLLPSSGFLELSSDHLDTGFLGASFNCGNGQSIAANIHGSSGNLYHMHDQKFIINQLNAADFLTHKLIDARLDGENTVKDVRCVIRNLMLIIQ